MELFSWDIKSSYSSNISLLKLFILVSEWRILLVVFICLQERSSITWYPSVKKILKSWRQFLLGVGTSTANCVSELEMGFKPFLLGILTLKMNFYLKIKNGKSKCDLSRSCLSLIESLDHSSFLDNLGTLLKRIGVAVDQIDDTTLSRLNDNQISIITQVFFWGGGGAGYSIHWTEYIFILFLLSDSAFF